MSNLRPWVLLVLSPLAGCATLGEAECLRGDWYSIGESDALSGHSASRLQRHHEACARHGVTPDPGHYGEGYGDGLLRFCVPEQAFALGRRGASYWNQCPQEREAAFLPAYALGLDVYGIEKELLELETAISELRDEVDDQRTSAEARDAAGRQLDAEKRTRRRLEERRDERLSLARSLGYGNVW